MDERVDALIRRLETPATLDEGFVSTSLAHLLPLARRAQSADRTPVGRLRRDLALVRHLGWSPARRATLAGVLLLVALLLAVLVIVVIGAFNRPSLGPNGLLIVSAKGHLEAIDPATGAIRPILPEGEQAIGVSRSPDGGSVAFWITEGSRSHLYVIGVDGGHRRELAADLSVTTNQSNDSWSRDSQFLAVEVTMNGASRILVVDVATGVAKPVTPRSVAAHNPLWSPDGAELAFQRDTASGHTMSVVLADGSEMHDLAGLSGLDPNGPDSWSTDGRWIYFGGGDAGGSQHVFRVDVLAGRHEQLSAPRQSAPGITLSPDDQEIVFNVDAGYGFDTWIANSDGTAARLLLVSGGFGSWSPDGALVLVRWRPRVAELGGLATITTDGKDLKILVPFEASCRHGWDETCLLGYGWGQPR